MTDERPTTDLERAFMEAAGLTVPAPKSDPALWTEEEDRGPELAYDAWLEERIATEGESC